MGCGEMETVDDELAVQEGQTIFFGCVDFYSALCIPNQHGSEFWEVEEGGETLNGGSGEEYFNNVFRSRTESHSYARALEIWSECVEEGGHAPGYCHASLKTTAFMRNCDVCGWSGGATYTAYAASCTAANTNLGFHIRIPFTALAPQTVNFRFHLDWGSGGFLGFDGPAKYINYDAWGHVKFEEQRIDVGDHAFEGLGFDGCCDGHQEAEIQLPCDVGTPFWRTPVTGATPCLSCSECEPCSVPANFASKNARLSAQGCIQGSTQRQNRGTDSIGLQIVQTTECETQVVMQHMLSTNPNRPECQYPESTFIPSPPPPPKYMQSTSPQCFYHLRGLSGNEQLHDWMAAEDDCAATGGHLAHIDSRNQLEALANAVPPDIEVWIGLHKSSCDDPLEAFAWSAGTVNTFSDWQWAIDGVCSSDVDAFSDAQASLKSRIQALVVPTTVDETHLRSGATIWERWNGLAGTHI
eukprot:COSAG04_NODE_5277_length_1675_cov_0.872462_1_plen_467_part_01